MIGSRICRGFIAGAAFALAVVTSPASGQAVKSTVVAPNGLEVTVYSDDFAERYEYTAPIIDIDKFSYALVAKIVENGKSRPVSIVGSISYQGDWRYYEKAIFRGGVEASTVFGDRNVVTCSGSRYGGGCTLREGFQITPTPEQWQSFAASGVVQIQLRAKDASTTLISVPVSYREAVEAVAAAKN